MAITAEDIQNASFTIDRKGYDVDEVDVFLEHVADEIDELNRLISELQAESEDGFAPVAPAGEAAGDAADLERELAAREKEIEELEAEIDDLREQLDEKAANDAAISQALIVAQRSADEVVANAKAEAASIIRDADDQADRIVEKAEADRQTIIEAIRTLEGDREDVRVEYRDMLSNFMADAQKILASIDGDARRAQATYQRRAESHAVSYGSASDLMASTPARAAAPAASYAAPAPSATAAVAHVEPGYVEKDYSGFGDAADGFAFDDID